MVLLKELTRCSACFSAARIIPPPACFSTECSNINGMRRWEQQAHCRAGFFTVSPFCSPRIDPISPWIYPVCTDAARSHSALSLTPFWVSSGQRLATIPNCMLYGVDQRVPTKWAETAKPILVKASPWRCLKAWGQCCMCYSAKQLAKPSLLKGGERIHQERNYLRQWLRIWFTFYGWAWHCMKERGTY